MKKVLGTVITLAICIGGLASLQWPRLRSQLARGDLDPAYLKAEETLQGDRLRLLKSMPDFGFDNLVADWTFLNFFQYFGYTEARQITGFSIAPDFFDVIITHDPYYRLPYQFLSSSVTLFAGRPDKTVQLLEQGLSHLTPSIPPDAFWLWRYKAIDELLFLGDVDAAIQSLEKNAEWARQSPVPDAAGYAASAQSTADFLRQNPESSEVRAAAWLMIWANAISEGVRQRAVNEIEALGYRLQLDDNGVQLIPIAPDAPPSAPNE